jgi:hypothetical protein
MILFAVTRRLRKFVLVLPVALGGIVSFLSLIVLVTNQFSNDPLPINRPLVNWLWILPICLAIVATYLIKTDQIKQEVYVVSFLIVGSTFGAYLSQGYKGSSYSLGGAYLLVCYLAIVSTSNLNKRQITKILALMMSTTLWFCGYCFVGERYADKAFTSQNFELDLTNFQDGFLPIRPEERIEIRKLKIFFEENPGTFVELPMEDPLILIDREYLRKGRCSQLIWITCADARGAAMQLLESPPNYFILKSNLQLPWNPEPAADPVITQIINCLKPILKLSNYSVYKADENEECLMLGLHNE